MVRVGNASHVYTLTKLQQRNVMSTLLTKLVCFVETLELATNVVYIYELLLKCERLSLPLLCRLRFVTGLVVSEIFLVESCIGLQRIVGFNTLLVSGYFSSC